MCSRYFVLSLCLFASLGLGCGRAPSRVVPEAPASNAGAAAVTAHDADKNGLLDESELQRAPGLKAALKQADTDGDGRLSAAEIDARISAWAKSKVGRMSVACIVMRQGTPLADAEVRFVPESFLGSALPTATAKTNAQGLAMPSAPQSEEKPPGVPPAFYRVEITTAAGDIPASYNTMTTLGAEVAPDVSALMMGPLRFELP
jgi:hypothetical protein